MKQRIILKNKTINADIIGFLLLLFFCAYYGHADLFINIRNFSLNIKHLLFIILIAFTLIYLIADILKKRLSYKQYSFFLWYTAFLLYCCLSMAWAPDSSISAEAVESLLNSFAMLFVVVCYVSSEAKFFRIINIQLSAFCYMAVRLIIFMPERWLFGRGRSRLFIENIIGIHYNGLAFFLTLGIILAAFLYLKTKSRFAMVLIPFFLYVIFLGGSRQGVIISVAGLLAMYALRKGIKQIYKTVITLAAIIIVFLFYINSDLPGAERILSLINGFFGGTAETSFNERALFRKWATAEFLQRPFFGWGVSSFKYYLISINYFRIHNHSHNTYTELLFCLGITGFVMYYSIYLRILIQAVKNLSAENLYAILSIIIIFVMLVFGYGEVLFYQARGPTAALALFYAFYALKLYNEQPKERTNQ